MGEPQWARLGEIAASPGFDSAAIRAAFAGALGKQATEFYRDQIAEQRTTMKLAVLGHGEDGSLDRWVEEAARRAKQCRMSRLASLESVYQDLIAGRMR